MVTFGLVLTATVVALRAQDQNAGPTDAAVAAAWENGEPFKILTEAATAESKGDYDSAIAAYTRAIALDPDYMSAYFGRGNAYLYKDKVDPAVADFAVVLQLNPTLDIAYRRIAECYRRRGDYTDALTEANNAIALNRAKSNPYGDRGSLYFEMGDFDKAIDDFSREIELSPPAYPHAQSTYGTDCEVINEDSDRVPNTCGLMLYQIHDDPYHRRGKAYAAKGDYEKAIADYDFCLQLLPKDAQLYFDRAIARQKKGDNNDALADFEQSAQLDPQNPWPYNDVAWNLATSKNEASRDGAKALEYATEACELSQGKEPAIVDTLAAAYAEVGDFDQAVKWENAYLLAPNLSASDEGDGKSRLALYLAHHAYHAGP